MKVYEDTYALNGCEYSCHDKHGREGDHHSVGEVVNVEEECHETNESEDKGLEEGVGQMVKDPAAKNNLDHSLADALA